MTENFPAKLPAPPYYAVIFTSVRTPVDDKGYDAMATAMIERASQQPGFLGIESARDEAGRGLTVSYWSDEQSIKAWKADAEHLVAQKLGRDKWYADFALRVAKVERVYRF